MIKYLILFLVIAIAIMFLAHYFLFYSIAKFIGAGRLNVKWLLIVFLLSGSFILASVLTNFFDSQAAKVFYYIVSLWHGALVLFLVSSVLLWAAYLANRYFAKNLNIRMAAFAVFGATVLAVIYGLLNASSPRVKNIILDVEGLNEYWQDKAIVQISDVHMGAINGAGYMMKIAEIINNEKPDLVLITGDYFDGTCKKFEELASPLKNINSSEGVFFINGNHETYAGRNGETDLCGILEDTGVKCLRDESVSINGLTITGLEYPAKADSLKILEDLDPLDFNIFLYHEPRFIEEAKKSSVNLQLAGHTHKGQIFPLSFFTRLIYGKYHYGLFAEENYNIYTTSGTGTWGPPLRIGTKPEIVKIKLRGK